MKLTHKFREFWTKDRAVLVTCIGIALCFWLLNKLSTSFTKTFPIKVEYNLPAGKALSSIPPQYALVTVKGTGWDILSANTEYTITLDVNSVDSTQMFSLRNAFLQNTYSDIITITPDMITIGIEDAVSKQVPIQPLTHISFEKGFDYAEEISLSPSSVTISGPESFIHNITAIRTDTIKAINLNEKWVQKVRLLPHPILKYSTHETEASIKVEQFTEKSMFVPIVVKNAPQQLKIFPNKIKLDCTVALSHYMQLNPSNFVAEVDMKGIVFNTQNNTIAITLMQSPNYVRDVKFTPKSAEFYFEK